MSLTVRDTLAILGLALVSHVAACQRNTSRPLEHRDAGAAEYPRYWLLNTTLLDERGKSGFDVKGPALVELLPGARVRSLAGAAPVFVGTLPPDVLQEPQSQRGLMLYAQRVSELRWRRPDGAVLGRLHPGAFISVVPAGQAQVRVGNLPFKGANEMLVAYADRAALGPERHEPAAFKPAGKGRSKRLPYFTGWVQEPGDAQGTSAAWAALDCEDVWVSTETSSIAQYSSGVELIGSDEDGLRNMPCVIYETLRCPASSGSQPITQVGDEPLADLIRRRGSVHWLIDSDQGLVCDEWRFEPKRGRTGRLTRRKPYQRQVASFPFEYRPARGPEHATLLLSSLELDRSRALRCPCDMDYKLLQADPTLLTMMGRPLPAGLRGYRPGEAERWFLGAEQCEQARVESLAALERDATTATQLGFHAVFATLGI